MPDLLLELGSEEIPARFIDRAVPALRKAVADGLAAANLPAAEVRADGTPRRLAVWAGGLPGRQPDVTEEKQGPRRASAFEDGAPTVAAEQFAASMGLAVDQLETRLVKKGKKEAEYLFATREVPGRPAPEVLAELIPGWIEGIPFPKSMRWVPGSKKRFARPLRSIAALLDDYRGTDAWEWLDRDPAAIHVAGQPAARHLPGGPAGVGDPPGVRGHGVDEDVQPALVVQVGIAADGRGEMGVGLEAQAEVAEVLRRVEGLHHRTDQHHLQQVTVGPARQLRQHLLIVLGAGQLAAAQVQAEAAEEQNRFLHVAISLQAWPRALALQAYPAVKGSRHCPDHMAEMPASTLNSLAVTNLLSSEAR